MLDQLRAHGARSVLNIYYLLLYFYLFFGEIRITSTAVTILEF